MQTPALEKATFWTVLSESSSSDFEALIRLFSQFGTVFISSTIVSPFPGIPHKYQFGLLTNTTEDIITSTFHSQYPSFSTSKLIIINSGPVTNQLFISSVPDTLTNKELQTIISPHSQCAVYIRKDLENPNTRVAFLIFRTPTEAAHAFMDRLQWTIDGTPLEVTFTTESPLSPRFLMITIPPQPKKAVNAPHQQTKATVDIENISQETTLREMFEYSRTLHGKKITFQIPENVTVMGTGSVQLQGSESLQFASFKPSFAIDFRKPATEVFHKIFQQPHQTDTKSWKKTVLFNSTPDPSVPNSIAIEVADIIQVDNESENGWTLGTNERTKETGWVPTSFLGPQIASDVPQPIEQLVLFEALVPQHTQSQIHNIVPFLQKFGEILSFNPISQSPPATDESFRIVILSETEPKSNLAGCEEIGDQPQQNWPLNQPLPHLPPSPPSVYGQNSQMMPVGQVEASLGKDGMMTSPVSPHSPPVKVSSPPIIFPPPPPVIPNDHNRALNTTSLTVSTQPVQPIEMTHNLTSNVTPSSRTLKDDTPRICAISGKEIVHCAHLKNEPGVFYEWAKLREIVRDTAVSPHSYNPVSLEDIVMDS
ncbi:hypothetical protein BLNAU_15319 [Blattamonas nauphoetae]|uniref:SH3 domain-containing protein n=1 Tax=Blattamonas nauphoetae TaxID=2049346 RepID=A0ABQ9XED3_9EUKA|nr:hypothetical protein BLNAU_15319 [Blattamonas nauphoetae]